MSSMTKDEINTDLFDECKRLRAEIERLEGEIVLALNEAIQELAHRKRLEGALQKIVDHKASASYQRVTVYALAKEALVL